MSWLDNLLDYPKEILQLLSRFCTTIFFVGDIWQLLTKFLPNFLEKRKEKLQKTSNGMSSLKDTVLISIFHIKLLSFWTQENIPLKMIHKSIVLKVTCWRIQSHLTVTLWKYLQLKGTVSVESSSFWVESPKFLGKFKGAWRWNSAAQTMATDHYLPCAAKFSRVSAGIFLWYSIGINLENCGWDFPCRYSYNGLLLPCYKKRAGVKISRK